MDLGQRFPESGWVLPDGRFIPADPHRHHLVAQEEGVDDPWALGWIKTHFREWHFWVGIGREPTQKQIDTLADWANRYHSASGGALEMMQMIDSWQHHQRVESGRWIVWEG